MKNFYSYYVQIPACLLQAGFRGNDKYSRSQSAVADLLACLSTTGRPAAGRGMQLEAKLHFAVKQSFTTGIDFYNEHLF
jgi:hypothetical protein